MKNETEVRIIIISNPVGCPHRSQLGGCLALETNWDDVPPNCDKIDFPAYCPLKKYIATINQVDNISQDDNAGGN